MTDKTEDTITILTKLGDAKTEITYQSHEGEIEVDEEITPELIVKNNEDIPLEIEFGWCFENGGDKILQETAEDIGAYELGEYQHSVVGGLVDAVGGDSDEEFDAYFEPDTAEPGDVVTLVIEVPICQEAGGVDMVWKPDTEFVDVELTSFSIDGDASIVMLSLVDTDGIVVASQEDIGPGMLVAKFDLTVATDASGGCVTEEVSVSVRGVAEDGSDVEHRYVDVPLSVVDVE